MGSINTSYVATRQLPGIQYNITGPIQRYHCKDCGGYMKVKIKDLKILKNKPRNA